MTLTTKLTPPRQQLTGLRRPSARHHQQLNTFPPSPPRIPHQNFSCYTPRPPTPPIPHRPKTSPDSDRVRTEPRTTQSSKEANNAGKQNTRSIYWCPGPESNRHGPHEPRDFKSLASTYSATRAYMPDNLILYFVGCNN